MSSPATSHTGRTAELRALAAGLGAILVLALAGAGCGSEDSDAAAGAGPDPDGAVVDISGTEPVGEMTAGSVAQLAECRDWNGGTPEQQLATIADVRSQINLEDSGIDAPALTDEEAQEMFDRSCKPAWAQGFRLYKLYARAAGWLPLKRALDE